MNKNENIAEAVAETVAEPKAVVTSKTPAEIEAYLNEYVSVKLFRDNDHYKDDVYVAVNGQNCVIKRGVWVKIKRKFALVLDQSEIQDLRTSNMMEREAIRFKEESVRFGL